MNSYTTVQGDTWDSVAFRFYNDENRADDLMKANPDKIEWFIFDSGVELVIPELAELEAERISRDYPEWRRASVSEVSVYD